MAREYPWYWLAVNIATKFIPNKFGLDNVILSDDNSSLDRIIEEPTIFLANHTYSKDIPKMHLAIQRALAHHPQDHRRAIITVSKDDNYRDIRKSGPKANQILQHYAGIALNNSFNLITGLAGTIFVHQKDSSKPKPRIDPLRQMIPILSNGGHILIYPTGSVSVDGRVDYQRNDQIEPTQYRHLSIMARRVPNLIVQAIHHTIDPVNEKNLIRMGERHRVQDLTAYSFTEDLAKCTTITALQLLTAYKNTARSNHTQQKQETELAKDVSELADELSQKGYHIYNPRAAIEKALHYSESKNSQHIISVENKDVNIFSEEYQLNQTKHLKNLEQHISEFQRRKS